MEYAWLCPDSLGKKAGRLLLSLKDGIYFEAPHPLLKKLIHKQFIKVGKAASDPLKTDTTSLRDCKVNLVSGEMTSAQLFLLLLC